MAHPRAEPVVTLYSRPGCHLCDEVERHLRELLPRFRFTLSIEDIERDDALLRRYMYEIPVVTVDGREVAKAPISRPSLEAALAEALS